MAYRWMVLIFAVIVLILIAATHALPTSIRNLRHPDPFYIHKTKRRDVQDCVAAAGKAERKGGNCVDPENPNPRPTVRTGPDDDQRPCKI